jgi:hypothetical protein
MWEIRFGALRLTPIERYTQVYLKRVRFHKAGCMCPRAIDPTATYRKQRLAEFPEATRAEMQAAHALRKPVTAVTISKVEGLAAPSSDRPTASALAGVN